MLVDVVVRMEKRLQRDQVLLRQRLVDDGAEGQRLAELLAGEGLAEGLVEVEDEGAGLGALAGEEAFGGEAREGEQPGGDVGLVAIRVQRLLGAEVGVERGEAGSVIGGGLVICVYRLLNGVKMRWNGVDQEWLTCESWHRAGRGSRRARPFRMPS